MPAENLTWIMKEQGGLKNKLLESRRSRNLLRQFAKRVNQRSLKAWNFN